MYTNVSVTNALYTEGLRGNTYAIYNRPSAVQQQNCSLNQRRFGVRAVCRQLIHHQAYCKGYIVVYIQPCPCFSTKVSPIGLEPPLALAPSQDKANEHKIVPSIPLQPLPSHTSKTELITGSERFRRILLVVWRSHTRARKAQVARPTSPQTGRAGSRTSLLGRVTEEGLERGQELILLVAWSCDRARAGSRLGTILLMIAWEIPTVLYMWKRKDRSLHVCTTVLSHSSSCTQRNWLQTSYFPQSRTVELMSLTITKQTKQYSIVLNKE